MMTTDGDSLACDLAETYQIYDLRQFTPRRIAVFACGLRDDSRIKLKISGQPVASDTWLLASIADSVNVLIWQLSGNEDIPRPALYTEMLSGKQIISKEPDSEIVGFDSGEEFLIAWNTLKGED